MSGSRRGWIGLVRVLATAILTVVLLLAAGVAVLWPLTPSASDAWTRIAADVRPHGGVVAATASRPDRVGTAIIATENSRFGVDFGVDPLGVWRAAEGAILQHDTGAATLEQQLAKRLYTPADHSVRSRITAVEMSLKLDSNYSKATILRMYLSDVYFGHGFYGLDSASAGYFGRPPGQLSWSQASLLAGLVQSPTAYDPYQHLTLARDRQRHVLDRLVATGTLTTAQSAAAYRAPLHLQPSR